MEQPDQYWENKNKDEANARDMYIADKRSEGHRYWANAFGTAALFVMLIFLGRTCRDLAVEREKTEQIKIQNGIKK